LLTEESIQGAFGMTWLEHFGVCRKAASSNLINQAMVILTSKSGGFFIDILSIILETITKQVVGFMPYEDYQ
jgi:hypothetical protein